LKKQPHLKQKTKTNLTTKTSTQQALKVVDVVLLKRFTSTKIDRSGFGAFGGIWTRDHYLTKVTPHRARLRRQFSFSLKEHSLGHKELTVFEDQKPKN
jgi:hypothetical protein